MPKQPLMSLLASLRDCFCYSRYRMRIDRSKWKPLPVVFAIGGLVSAGAVGQHVHGVVELGVVMDDDTIAVSLSAPLSDVVGFEHEPVNDEQVKRIQQAASMLSNADAMFGLAESANCEVSDTTVDGPLYVKKYLGEEGIGLAEHDDQHHDGHDSPGSDSAGEEHAEPGDHDHRDSEEHAEVSAHYEWVCGDVSELDSVTLPFTDNFASVETIEIQILTSAGAKVLTEKGRAASVSLPQP